MFSLTAIDNGLQLVELNKDTMNRLYLTNHEYGKPNDDFRGIIVF